MIGQDPNRDTIVAQATPPGRGGVAIVRISGPNALSICQHITGKNPTPRYAHYTAFLDDTDEVIDLGIILYFPAPHSFTGEDVIEFQGHGGPIIIERLLNRIVDLGARVAQPGEFSRRAFLNDKIDLTQAEAIADLIDSASIQASKMAIRSLQGEFSKQIHLLVEQLIHLRMYVEAALDFPEEEIDFLNDGKVSHDLSQIIKQLKQVEQQAQQGSIFREGITIVIAGKPNAGKSTLLNQLSGRDVAIVTEIAGTTRDIMRETISLDGIPINLIDTAGLRDSEDIVEQEGIRRAKAAIKMADLVLYIHDVQHNFNKAEISSQLLTDIPATMPMLIIMNKADTLAHPPEIIATQHRQQEFIYLSAKTGEGIEQLKHEIKTLAGCQVMSTEVGFMARQRHLSALTHANKRLTASEQQFKQSGAGELLAEDLKLAQASLNEITGEFSNDDLLGRIFSSFCIGK